MLLGDKITTNESSIEEVYDTEWIDASVPKYRDYLLAHYEAFNLCAQEANFRCPGRKARKIVLLDASSRTGECPDHTTHSGLPPSCLDWQYFTYMDRNNTEWPGPRIWIYDREPWSLQAQLLTDVFDVPRNAAMVALLAEAFPGVQMMIGAQIYDAVASFFPKDSPEWSFIHFGSQPCGVYDYHHYTHCHLYPSPGKRINRKMILYGGQNMEAITWLSTRTDAIAAGKAQGKKILLLGGDTNCSRTLNFKDVVCEMTSPPIKSQIENNLIPWFGDRSKAPGGKFYNSDWYSYPSGLGAFIFPLLCVIDPNDANNYLDRTADRQDPQVFYDRLLKYPAEGVIPPEKTSLFFPHSAVINGWETELAIINNSNQPVSGSIKVYNEAGTLLDTRAASLPAFGRKQILISAEFAGKVVDYIVFSTDGDSVCGYTKFYKTGLQRAALPAILAGKTFGVFPKLEKEGWTGIAFVNMEEAVATVSLTAYSDAGIVIASKPLSVPAHVKVVNSADAIFAQDISKATYFTFLSDRKVAGFQLNGTTDERMLDGLNAL